MNETIISTILHPVRMRIIQTLVGGHRLTVQQINEILSDVPPATMYRQLKKLLDAGVISVVEENQVRGTVEKVYSLVDNLNEKTAEEIIHASKEEHMKYFFTFLMNVLADFEKYVSQEQFDMVKDGVAYRQARILADDNEFTELIKTIGGAISRVSANKPAPGRRERTLTTIILPQVSSSPFVNREDGSDDKR